MLLAIEYFTRRYNNIRPPISYYLHTLSDSFSFLESFKSCLVLAKYQRKKNVKKNDIHITGFTIKRKKNTKESKI